MDSQHSRLLETDVNAASSEDHISSPVIGLTHSHVFFF